MKLKSFFTAILLGVCIISGPQDIYGQKKSSQRSGKAATTKRGTTTQNSTLVKENLLDRSYVGWADVNLQGARIASGLDFNSSYLTFYFGSKDKINGAWTIANNKVSFEMNGFPVKLTSKDKGKTLEGTCMMGNKSIPVKYYSWGEKGIYDESSLLAKIKDGKYTASLDGNAKGTLLNIPANFKLNIDEDDPDEMTYKITGDVEIYTYIGSIKGEIYFDEDEIVITGLDDEEYSVKYKDINENILKLPLGSKNIPNFGSMDFSVYLYF